MEPVDLGIRRVPALDKSLDPFVVCGWAAWC